MYGIHDIRFFFCCSFLKARLRKSYVTVETHTKKKHISERWYVRMIVYFIVFIIKICCERYSKNVLLRCNVIILFHRFLHNPLNFEHCSNDVKAEIFWNVMYAYLFLSVQWRILCGWVVCIRQICCSLVGILKALVHFVM